MTQQWSLPAWVVVAGAAAALVLALLVAVLGLLRARAERRQAERIARAESTAEALREQVAAIERRLAAVGARSASDDAAGYVITGLDPTLERTDRDQQGVLAPVPTVPAPLFADLVLRESVVQAAGLAAGLRRALAPETRHRIRFAMRQEVKRARKQRRTDLRHARRAWEAHQRDAARRGDGHGEGPSEGHSEGSAA